MDLELSGVLGLLSLLALLGCSQAGGSSERGNSDDQCSGNFDELALGLEKTAEPAGLTIGLYEADPLPPAVRNDNVWRVVVRDASGQPVTGAEIVATPFMPKHQHAAAQVVVEDLDEGRYELSPIELIMPGVWEIPIDVTPPGSDASSASFRFCIAER
jgi:hypothetical protein